MSVIRELASGKDVMNFLDFVAAMRPFVPEIRVVFRDESGELHTVKAQYVWPEGETAYIELTAGEPVRALSVRES